VSVAAGSAAELSPHDRALALLLENDALGALRHAVPLLQREAASPLSLILVGMALSKLGDKEPAATAFRTSIERSVDSANLPLAVAACAELHALGIEVAAQFDSIAKSFAKGSKRLTDRRAPPELRGAPSNFQPLTTLDARAVRDQAEAAADHAQSLLEDERKSEPSPPELPQQVLFSSLSVGGLRLLVESFEERVVPIGATLIEEGSTGAEAFVLARGELEVQKAQRDGGKPLVLARLGSGAVFGEMALLSRSPRAASVTASRPSIVLVARKAVLDSLAHKEPEIGQVLADFCRRRMVDNLVRTSSILGAVKATERSALLDRFVTRTFEPGERLIVQGKDSEGLHLVASGELQVEHDENGDKTVITKLGPGEVVGEVSLVLRRPSNADVVAVHPTVTLHLPRDRFLEVIKSHPTVLAELYELAVKRDDETSSVVAREATEVDESVLL
jgi:CRP-like cAMP-binding protein